jgi:mRNA interferase MazF
MAVDPRRGDVCLVELDPVRSSEMRKTRPCLVVSPDEMNRRLDTLIVAPMTTGGHAYSWRIVCRFQNRHGFVALEQVRTVDRERLVRKLGKINPATLRNVLMVFQEMFAA